MYFHIPFCCKFFFAYSTRVLHFLMDWFNMSLETSVCCKFIFTLVTRILDFLMDCFNVSLQISFRWKLTFISNCARVISCECPPCDRVRSTLYSVSSNILCSDKHQRPLLLPLFSIVLRDIYSLYACLTWHLSLDINHKHDNTPQTAWYLLPTVSHW